MDKKQKKKELKRALTGTPLTESISACSSNGKLSADVAKADAGAEENTCEPYADRNTLLCEARRQPIFQDSAIQQRNGSRRSVCGRWDQLRLEPQHHTCSG